MCGTDPLQLSDGRIVTFLISEIEVIPVANGIHKLRCSRYWVPSRTFGIFGLLEVLNKFRAMS